jgi:hypothetical protein
MMPLPDWDNPVYTLDDEAFRALEQPKPRYLYDEFDMPPTLITRDTYPELVGRWEPGTVTGRA